VESLAQAEPPSVQPIIDERIDAGMLARCKRERRAFESRHPLHKEETPVTHLRGGFFIGSAYALEPDTSGRRPPLTQFTSHFGAGRLHPPQEAGIALCSPAIFITRAAPKASWVLEMARPAAKGALIDRKYRHRQEGLSCNYTILRFHIT
jgi:hypothetical protein